LTGVGTSIGGGPWHRRSGPARLFRSAHGFSDFVTFSHFVHPELDEIALVRSTFTDDALALVVRSSEVGSIVSGISALLESVRGG